MKHKLPLGIIYNLMISSMNFQNWNEAVFASLQNLWNQIIAFIPQLVGAILILIVGLVLASLLSKLVYKLISLTRVDKLIDKLDATKKMEEIGLKFSLSGFIAWIVKWFFIVVTLIAVVNILKLTEVNNFLQSVVLYIPNVVVAVFILAIGLVLGQFAHDVVEKSAKASNMAVHTVYMLSAIAKWSLIIFSLMISSVQLKVGTEIIMILFTGLVATISVALGLAFGLGGREHAAKLLDEVMAKRHHL